MATDGTAPRSQPLVRPAHPSEDQKLTDVLARSFWDDPVTTYMIPSDRLRYPRQRHLFRAELHGARRRGEILTTDDLAGASLWLRPHEWKTPNRELLAMMPHLVLAFGGRLRAVAKLVELIERKHPTEPHWYLADLGTDPARQGLGVGGALITAITDRCDREGVGAYLESSKAVNVPYYERFGFRVTEAVTVPDGPTIWLMWRDPVAPTA